LITGDERQRLDPGPGLGACFNIVQASIQVMTRWSRAALNCCDVGSSGLSW
jgi:hypothetical protein